METVIKERKMSENIFDILESIPAVEQDEYDRSVLSEIEKSKDNPAEYVSFTDFKNSILEERKSAFQRHVEHPHSQESAPRCVSR